MRASSSIGSSPGGMPPGLGLPPPPRPVSPKKSKRQVIRGGDPTPKITDEEFDGVGRALDIWERLANPGENPQATDDIFFEGNSMNFARQCELFRLESRRARDFTYANRAARDGRKQRIRFGEVAMGYTPGDEVYGALARNRQSQYEYSAKEKQKKQR